MFTVVQHGGDEPRFLGARLDYAAYPTMDALECVRAAEQEAISKQVREAERARAADEWRTANAAITSAVKGFQERSGHVSPGVRSGVRAVLRASEQVGRRLQASTVACAAFRNDP